jgi:hypothetical protein
MNTLTDPHAPTAIVIQTGDGQVFQFPGPVEAQQFETSAAQAGSETTRLLPPPPPLARPLYDIEQHLISLLDTEEIVPPEEEEAYGKELQTVLTEAVEKRDRVGQFRIHLQFQIATAHAERKRLDEREAFYQRALDRLDAYISKTVESLGLDAKGKRKKLEGKVITLSLHGCDKRVHIIDEMLVPTKYKRATITLPAETWELVCDSLDLDLREQVLAEVTSPKIEVSTSKVKSDLKADVDVPGAELVGGTYVQVQ